MAMDAPVIMIAERCADLIKHLSLHYIGNAACAKSKKIPHYNYWC